MAKVRGAIVFFFFILYWMGCTSSPIRSHDTGFSLIRLSDSLYYLRHTNDSVIDQWELPYRVYRFEVGDVDGNGVEDALVGVIKSTRFFPTKDKRLFIFKNYKGYVRPLWLGSRVGSPLEDFRFVRIHGEPRVRCMEREQSGSYLVSEYRWQSFGLRFVRYLQRESDAETAKSLLQVKENQFIHPKNKQ